MKKQIFVMLTAAVLGAAVLSGCSSKGKNAAEKKTVTLTISAAASLTDVTKDIAEKYKEKEPNVELRFSYGSSGALQTQIEEGGGRRRFHVGCPKTDGCSFKKESDQ